MTKPLSDVNWKTNYWQKSTVEPIGNSNEIPERERILQPYLYPPNDTLMSGWIGGTRHFHGAPPTVIELLIKKGYLKKSETQNESPTSEQFLRFMKRWRQYNILAHGYEVSKERDDCRITIEGLEFRHRIDEDDEHFYDEWHNFNHGADELNANYSWWD